MKQVCLLLAAVLVLSSINAQVKNDIEKYNSKKHQSGFIENKGQIYDQNYKPNQDVRYILSVGNGINVQLKKNSFSYDTYKKELKGKDISYSFHRVDIEMPGANASPEIIAEGLSADHTNYYNSITPENGVTNVRNFKKVTYKDIYPGIDMVFLTQTDEEKPFEYTFVVHPGADAGQIQLHYRGANETHLTDNKINIDVDNGRFNENIPASWIKETKTKLKVGYKNINKDTYGFNVPAYSSSQTLIIDPNPNLDWATYYGGTGIDHGWAIACDYIGYVFITGYTNSTAAIATSGAFQTNINGANTDAFITKFDNNGVRLWGTYYGGDSDDYGLGVVCDKDSGNVYINGTTSSGNVIATNGSHQSSIGGNSDAFVVKFDGNTGFRIWGTYYGGLNDDHGIGITCNNDSANIFITGYTNSNQNISSSLGVFQANLAGGSDAFIAKFNRNGVLQWSTYYGGTGDDIGIGIACDGSNVSITGSTTSATGIASPGAWQAVYAGASDAFVAQFNPVGGRLWGSYFGGAGIEFGNAITCDYSNKDVIITGSTSSDNGLISLNQYQSNYGGGTNDVFVAKFKSIVGSFKWSTYFGGSQSESTSGIVSDNSGNYTITGYTSSSTAIATNSTYQYAYGGGTSFGDAFVAQISSDGKSRLWGTYFGGSDDDHATGIASDGYNYYVSGVTKSTLAIATDTAFQDNIGGGDDAFIAKFTTCPLPTFILPDINGPTTICRPNDTISTYTVLMNSATSYVWKLLPDNIIKTTTINNDTIYFNTYPLETTLYLSVYGKNSCGNSDTITSTIIIHSTPPAPVISFIPGSDSIKLISDSTVGIQWYNGGMFLSSETNQTCTATTNGDYHAVINKNGCTSAWSNILHVTHVGIEVNENNKAIRVYPNPVTDELYIEDIGNKDKLQIEIFNSIGQIVYKGSMIERIVVQTQNFAQGIYLIKLDSGKIYEFKKIIKK